MRIRTSIPVKKSAMSSLALSTERERGDCAFVFDTRRGSGAMGGGALGAGPYAHARGEDAVVHAFRLCHRVQLVHLLSPGQLPRQSRAWVCGCVYTRVWMAHGGRRRVAPRRAPRTTDRPAPRGSRAAAHETRPPAPPWAKTESPSRAAFCVATDLSFSSEDNLFLTKLRRGRLAFFAPSMAKSIRSKVKKRLRSVKRGVLKKDLQVCCGCPRTHTRTRAHTTPRFKSPRRSTISRQPPLASALHPYRRVVAPVRQCAWRPLPCTEEQRPKLSHPPCGSALSPPSGSLHRVLRLRLLLVLDSSFNSSLYSSVSLSWTGPRNQGG